MVASNERHGFEASGKSVQTDIVGIPSLRRYSAHVQHLEWFSGLCILAALSWSPSRHPELPRENGFRIGPPDARAFLVD